MPGCTLTSATTGPEANESTPTVNVRDKLTVLSHLQVRPLHIIQNIRSESKKSAGLQQTMDVR